MAKRRVLGAMAETLHISGEAAQRIASVLMIKYSI